jgi:hypothetical protein
MRQGDGSDLLGQSDPRSADIGILYVEPEDSRQEILTAINTQELQGRKQIAIVLPDQGKAFRQPVEFDGLKNMRRSLKATLIFIAPPGPGPAEFARQRRFVVYSSLETFRTALINEGAPYNPRAKAASGGEKRPGLLGRRQMNKGREQNAPAVPPVMPPTPPTPRIAPSAAAQPVMPPTPPTRVPSQAAGPEAQKVPAPISPMPPIEDIDTRTLEHDNPPAGRGSGAALAAGAAMGALAASALEGDDDLAPPVTPRQNQEGGVVPSAQGSASPTRTPDGRRAPTPLLLGQQTNTPRPGGSGKLPAASAQGSQTRSGSGKLSAVQGRGTKQLNPAQGGADAVDTPRTSNTKNGGSGKLPAAIPVGVAPVVPLAASGADAPAPGAAANASIPAAVAVTGTPGGVGAGGRQVGLTPLPPPVSQRRQRARGRKRLLLFALLGLLTLLVISGIVVSALGGPGGLATLGHLTATVTITPQSKVMQNNYLISGVTASPNADQRQVLARTISAQSDTKSTSANATGSVPATRATGSLVFFNVTSTGLTIAGGGQTVLTGANGVQVTFNEPVFVPATGSASATINDAYAIQSGAQGNIPAFDITGPCCVAGNKISVKNTAAFHGGQDAQPNSIIQQSDIDGAAKSLTTQLTSSTQATLQKQLKSNERVVDGTFNCKPTTNADHRAGDHASSVTVSVSVTCSEEVFDLAAAQRIASNLLPTNLPSGVDLSGYKLVGPIVTNLVSATQVSEAGQVSVNMQAAGRWVYQFSNQVQQQIKQSLLKKSKTDALGILRQYAGLASANITISSGSIMPAVTSDIAINIVAIPGLTPGAPPATATPYVPVGGTPTEAGTPTGNGTPNEGS